MTLAVDSLVDSAEPVYLRYYWSNYEKYASDDANAILDKIGRTKDEILQNSVDNAVSSAMKKVLTTFQNKDGSLTMEDLAVLENGFDGLSGEVLSKDFAKAHKMVSQAGKNDTLESGDLLKSFQEFASAGSSLTSASYRESFSSATKKLEEVMKRKASFNEALQKLIDSLSGSKNMKLLLEQYILNNYDQAKRELGNSQLCSQLIASIRANGTGTLYKWSRSDISTLRAPVREFLVKLYALSSGRVQIDASSRQALADSLSRFSASDFNEIQGDLGEMSLAMTKMAANELMYRAMDRHRSKMSDIALKSSVGTLVQTGNNLVSVTMSLKDDPALEAQLREIQRQIGAQNAGFNFQSGNVVGYGLSQQKTDSVIVDSVGVIDGGVTSKTARSLKSTKTGLKIGKLHLSYQTPLNTLLTNDIGWSGTDIERLMQLGIAQDDGGEDLASIWEGFKKYVVAQATLSALVGSLSSNSTISTLVQINDSIVPMPTVISKVAATLRGSDKGQSLFSSVGKMDIPDREELSGYSKSSWSGPSSSSMKYALERSSKTYSLAIRRLYDAKIGVTLNSFNMSVFDGLSFTH